MWGYVFSLILVGLPAAAGAFEIASDTGGSRISVGAALIVYSIMLAIVVGYFLPSGKLTDTPYAIVMPVVLLISLVAGGFAGFAQRKRSK